ncbi:MAG: asparagine synthase-related protein [Acidobacteriota bacterium]
MLGFGLIHGKQRNILPENCFTSQKGLEIGNLSIIYSRKSETTHNIEHFQADNAPFVFIYGEITNKHDFFNADTDPPTNIAREISLAIKRDGAPSIQAMTGMFTVVAYDVNGNILHIFNDKIGGIHTTYYRHSENTFLCSSSFQFITLYHNVSIDLDSLSNLFCRGYILPPKTLAHGISKNYPGTMLSVSGNCLATKTISTLPFLANEFESEISSGESYLAEYIEATTTKDACFLLSGGLDSSTLVGIAAKLLGNKVQCITGSFKGHKGLDETPYAELVSKHCSAQLNCIELGSDNVFQKLPAIVYALGEPFLDYSILPTYALFREISNDFRHVFSGDGPDHLFGRYYPLAIKRIIGLQAQPILNRIRNTKNKYIQRLLRSSSSDIEYAYSELFSLPNWGHNEVDKILSIITSKYRKTPGSGYVGSLAPTTCENSTEDSFRIINFADFYIDGSFGVFSKVGRAASSSNLLIREPYLSTKYAELIAGIPMKSKINGNFFKMLTSDCTTKSHLRNNISVKYLPPETIYRKKKGFTPPLEAWLLSFVENNNIIDRFSTTFKDIMDMSAVRELIYGFITTKHHGCLVFMLLSLDLWIRIFIENKTIDHSQLTLNEVYCVNAGLSTSSPVR